MEDATLAIPNVALTFAPGYLAEDWGLFAKQGLNLKSVVIAGIGSANAVISGSADFAEISGATLTRAAARGQRMVGIVGALNRPVIQIVLRKEIAAAAGFDPKAALDKRVQVLRGRTIAVDSINSVIHAYVLLLARRAGHQQARKAVKARMKVTKSSVGKSFPRIPKRRLASNRFMLRTAMMPIAAPMATSRMPSLKIRRRTCPRCAPRARRMPISCVRCVTA